MEVQSPADDVDGKGVGAWHIGSFCTAEAVARRIPRDDDTMARGRVFFQKLHESAQLIAAEVFAPPVAVGHRYRIGRIGECVPNFRKVAQKVGGLARAGDKPNLLGDEHFDGNFAQRQQRKSVLFNIDRKMHPRNRTYLMPRPRILLSHALFHDPSQHVLVQRVELSHGAILSCMKKIDYPYLPKGRTILYVPEDNPYMRIAREYAIANSL